jgi:hypothetical protein
LVSLYKKKIIGYNPTPSIKYYPLKKSLKFEKKNEDKKVLIFMIEGRNSKVRVNWAMHACSRGTQVE